MSSKPTENKSNEIAEAIKELTCEIAQTRREFKEYFDAIRLCIINNTHAIDSLTSEVSNISENM